MIFWLAIALLVLWAYIMWDGDCDMMVYLYEKYGKDPGNNQRKTRPGVYLIKTLINIIILFFSSCGIIG